MCGIYCRLRCAPITGSPSEMQHDIFKLLSNRGPDKSDNYLHRTPLYECHFSGHVLWQQGASPCSQPIVSGNDDNQNVLLLNGDIYTKRPNATALLSDTEWLMQKIVECQQDEEQFLDLFARQIRGPFSIVYFNGRTNTLYFMRDSLGRQSLLVTVDDANDFIVSSVATQKMARQFIELPPLGIFRIKCDENATTITLFPWHLMATTAVDEPPTENASVFPYRMAGDSLNPIWLQNKKMENWSFVDITALPADNENSHPSEIFAHFLQYEPIARTCNDVIRLLSASVRDRCNATPSICKNCHRNEIRTGCDHCKVGILFSGGIDCTILAVLANEHLNANWPIDLINVAFEKVRKTMAPAAAADIDYNTPDRISARQTLQELQTLMPKRTWNLVEVNVSRTELAEKLSSEISDCVYPLSTILDESLGAALWFAARAQGTLNANPYNSPCRVLLMGSGADELFGGYTRHRNAFRRGSWSALSAELHMDWQRLPGRNLARDDRVIGDRGITARSPYVEEDLSSLVRNLEASQKCLHTLQQGVGDKLLLRLCGHQLGLSRSCSLPKRALQFGSRVADSRQNAKDKSKALNNDIE